MLEVHPNAPAIRSVTAVLAGLDEEHAAAPPIATGFSPLDAVLNGGFRTRELSVLGGVPGAGKTVFSMQAARAAAMAGNRVVYVCYDHDHLTLLTRLLLLEVGDLVEGAPGASGPTRQLIHAIGRGQARLEDEVSSNLLLRAAHARIQDYGERLWLMEANRSDTDLGLLEDATAHAGPGSLMVIDFLQKVPHPEREDNAKVAAIAAGLKEIALDHDIAVLAVVAGDASALSQRRLRMRHLNGASGIGYEADLLMLLNEKYRAVSKLHSGFDAVRAERSKRQVVLSIEKYRQGPGSVDLEFTKDFSHFRFDPVGGHLEEHLIDDVMFTE